MAVEFHKLKVADVRRETPDAVSIAFAVPPELKDEYRFSPGQHLTLRRDCDGQDVRRSYSICNGLDDGELRVAVKKVEGGVFSTLVQRGDPAGRHDRRDDAAGPLRRHARSPARRAIIWRSRPAPASRRSCRCCAAS